MRASDRCLVKLGFKREMVERCEYSVGLHLDKGDDVGVEMVALGVGQLLGARKRTRLDGVVEDAHGIGRLDLSHVGLVCPKETSKKSVYRSSRRVLSVVIGPCPFYQT